MQAQQEEQANESPEEEFNSNNWTGTDSGRSTISTSTTYGANSLDSSSTNSSHTSLGTIVTIPASPPLSTNQRLTSRLPGILRRAATIQQHGLIHTIRILRTYPLMIAHRTQLPPFIHHLQIPDAIPPPALATCYNILISWEGFSSPNPAIETRILAEIDTLVKSVSALILETSRSTLLIRVGVDSQPLVVPRSFCSHHTKIANIL